MTPERVEEHRSSWAGPEGALVRHRLGALLGCSLCCLVVGAALAQSDAGTAADDPATDDLHTNIHRGTAEPPEPHGALPSSVADLLPGAFVKSQMDNV